MVYEEGKTPQVEEPLNTSMYDTKITEYINICFGHKSHT
jgi:hypothetical protein